MAQEFNFTLLDHSDLVRKATDEQIRRGLEAVGIQAEGDAKLKCPVDTGLLRNSITHAVGGNSPAISSYRGSKTHGTNPHTIANGTAGKPAPGPHSGSYSGKVGSRNDYTVYVGTNVEYAPYLEMGTSRSTAQPFLKPAMADNISTYKDIMIKYLKS